MKNMNWCVGRIEKLFIFSQIGLLRMKVARDIIETMEALLRYLGLRLLVIAIKTCEELILQTHGDYIETQ